MLTVEAGRALAAMLGSGVNAGEVLAGGNSRIFRIDCGTVSYALKEYPPEADDPRRRQVTERDALEFLHRQGMRRIPRFLQEFERYSLLSWIDGRIEREPNADAIAEAVAIVQELQALSSAPQAQAFAAAYEACASLDAFAGQLQVRIRALEQAAADADLLRFMALELGPAFERMRARAYDAYERHGLPTGGHREQLSLIHGDFGMHNILTDGNGALHLIDFEYFGWDDPVKMIADFALHPGVALSTELRSAFLDRVMRTFHSNKQMLQRLHALLPMFAVRWACISLNCFLPGRRADFGDVEARLRQLAQARSLLKLGREVQEQYGIRAS